MKFKDDTKFCLDTVTESCRGGGVYPGVFRVSFLNSVSSCICLRLQAEPRDLDILSSLSSDYLSFLL